MEVVGISRLFKTPHIGVVCIDGKYIESQSRYAQQIIHPMVDGLGRLSAIAQGLGAPVTSVSILEMHRDQRLYVAIDNDTAIGLLKVGPKRLFVQRLSGMMHELETICVLDFYTHESRQRQGIGYAMMTTMLKQEGISEKKIGYDRPSPKLLNFLAKHFELIEYVPQSNNFVVFEAAFADMPRTPYQRPSAASLEEIQRAITPAGRSFLFGGIDPVAAQAERKARYGGIPQTARCVVDAEETRASPLVTNEVRPVTAPAPSRSTPIAERPPLQPPRVSPLPTHTSPLPSQPRSPIQRMSGNPALVGVEQSSPGYADLARRQLTPSELYQLQGPNKIGHPHTMAQHRQLRAGMRSTRFR